MKHSFKNNAFPSAAWERDGNTVHLSQAFAVKNAEGYTCAAVTRDGEVYLLGCVYEEQSELGVPSSGTAFIVENGAGEVQSLIDDQGNLKARGNVLVRGVPYTLEQEHPGPTGDTYSTYP